jgi:DNA-binding NarL/FixJ family response regulator
MIRVLVAEDMRILRDTLVSVLNLEDDIKVVAQVAAGPGIVPAALAERPDLAVLDIDLPGLDGITAASQLHERLPACRVVILTVLGRPGQLRAALDAHVAGFMVKDAPSDQLIDVLRKLALLCLRMFVTASRTTGTRTAAASGGGSALTHMRTSMPADARTSRAAASSALSARSRASLATRRTSALAVAQIRASSAISSPALASSRPMSLPIRSAFIAMADRPRPRRSWVSLAQSLLAPARIA